MTPSTRKRLLLPIALFVIDGLLLGQGVWATLIAVVVVGINVPGAIYAKIKGDGDALRRRLQRAITYVLAAAAVLGVIALQNRHARQAAERIIVACDAYNEKYAHYPATLQELVPEFLSAVPRAKLAPVFGEFFYFEGRDPSTPDASPWLMYVKIPPFGRPTYHFKEKRWSYLD